MIEDINKKINVVKNQMAEKKVLEEKLKDLNQNIVMNEYELRDLEENLKKELHDVENLNKLSLSSFIYTIMGNKAEKMEKEEKECLRAKLKYDDCNCRLKSLKENKLNLVNKLNDLDDCEKRYSELLDTKVALVNIYGSEEEKNKILKIEEELDCRLKEIKEIEESIDVGQDLYDEIKCTKELLESAKTWSTIDLLGGDIISSMAKHEKIDNAQKHFSKISTLLTRFNEELRDVNISSLNFSGMTKGIDIFFDNIFTDISVNSKINNSYNDICNLQRKVHDRLEDLNKNRSRLIEEVENRRNLYDEFINSI